MKILITHLTRMTFPRICVAGRDVETQKSIRPVTTKNDPLETSRLGVFCIGGVVDLGKTAALPNPPEVEDHLFDPNHAERSQILAPQQFWQTIEGLALPSLQTIFGAFLQPYHYTFCIEPGVGYASLGEWRVAKAVLVMSYDKLRLRIGGLSFPVTDIRLYQVVNGGFQINAQAVEYCNRLLHNSEAVLSVGLSRAWSMNDEPARHWLQINGIHPAQEPLWGNTWNTKN